MKKVKWRTRYRKLTFWNKVGFWGSVSSIVGLLLSLFLVLFSNGEKVDSPEKVDHLLGGKENLRNIPRDTIEAHTYKIVPFIPKTIEVGDCNKVDSQHCLSVEYQPAIFEKGQAKVNLHGSWGVVKFGKGENGAGLTMPFKVECHFRIVSSVDVLITVTNDRVLYAELGVFTFPGTIGKHLEKYKDSAYFQEYVNKLRTVLDIGCPASIPIEMSNEPYSEELMRERRNKATSLYSS